MPGRVARAQRQPYPHGIVIQVHLQSVDHAPLALVQGQEAHAGEGFGVRLTVGLAPEPEIGRAEAVPEVGGKHDHVRLRAQHSLARAARTANGWLVLPQVREGDALAAVFAEPLDPIRRPAARQVQLPGRIHPEGLGVVFFPDLDDGDLIDHLYPGAVMSAVRVAVLAHHFHEDRPRCGLCHQELADRPGVEHLPRAQPWSVPAAEGEDRRRQRVRGHGPAETFAAQARDFDGQQPVLEDQGLAVLAGLDCGGWRIALTFVAHRIGGGPTRRHLRHEAEGRRALRIRDRLHGKQLSVRA